MADQDNLVATTFLEAWTPELAKSVEMFTGLSVTIQQGAEANTHLASLGTHSILWQTQTIEYGLTGSVWIGTPVTTRVAITKSLADDDETRESLYRELLAQSLEGAAHVLSSGQEQRLVCKTTLQNGTPPLDLTDTQVVWLNIPGQDPAPIFVGFQSDFMALLRAVEHGSSRQEELLQQTAPAPRVTPQESESMFDRLVDLELPMAVVLGRAQVKIQDALKLTAGSLVELDSRSSDSVEIVVHNAVVARGEVVSVGGNYGIRIREVISRKDRVALQNSASRSQRGTVQRP